MKTKQVTRYICEFCGKTGYSLGGMRKHEGHCTLNPERACGMCEQAGEQPAPAKEQLAAVVALVPKLEDFNAAWLDGEKYTDTTAAAEALRAIWGQIVEPLNHCPACIMAVLRQAKFPLPMVDWWSYTDACKEFWRPINEAKCVEDER
jgi:hypothetical protein